MKVADYAYAGRLPTFFVGQELRSKFVYKSSRIRESRRSRHSASLFVVTDWKSQLELASNFSSGEKFYSSMLGQQRKFSVYNKRPRICSKAVF